MLARLAEARAAHEHRADPEFTVDEMIERDTGRRDVAAGVGSGDLDPKPFPLGVPHAAQERLDGFHLDQRDFAPALARLFRVEPGPGEIPIALEPASRERPHFGDRLHRRRRFRRDMDGDDGAFPHATILPRSTACYTGGRHPWKRLPHLRMSNASISASGRDHSRNGFRNSGTRSRGSNETRLICVSIECRRTASFGACCNASE